MLVYNCYVGVEYRGLRRQVLERVACIRVRGKKVLEDVNIWRNMYRVVLCGENV